MKAYRKLCIIVIAVFLISAAMLDLILIKQNDSEQGLYRVEAHRLADEIERSRKPTAV